VIQQNTTSTERFFQQMRLCKANSTLQLKLNAKQLQLLNNNQYNSTGSICRVSIFKSLMRMGSNRTRNQSIHMHSHSDHIGAATKVFAGAFCFLLTYQSTSITRNILTILFSIRIECAF